MERGYECKGLKTEMVSLLQLTKSGSVLKLNFVQHVPSSVIKNFYSDLSSSNRNSPPKNKRKVNYY